MPNDTKGTPPLDPTAPAAPLQAIHAPCSPSFSEPDPDYDDNPEGYPVVMKKLESKLSELGVDEEDDQSLQDEDQDDVEPTKPPNL